MDELPDQPDTVDLSWIESYHGLTLQEAVERAEAEGRPYRVIGPHSVVTMDLRTDRLNLVVDDDEHLTSMRAG